MLVLENSASMSFFASDFTMDRKTCHMMAIETELHQASSEKHGYARPNLIWSSKSLGMTHSGEFAGIAFRNTILQPDQWGHTTSRILSWRERNPRTTTFIRPADQLRQMSRTPPPCPRPQPEVTSCCWTIPEATTCLSMMIPRQHAQHRPWPD
jgi:hypothetical protein